jgi:hypothetical protein
MEVKKELFKLIHEMDEGTIKKLERVSKDYLVLAEILVSLIAQFQ